MSGSAEIYEAVFSFDSYWDGFARTAVFECAGERREQLLVNDRCIVPWEILKAGAYLRVGVYGVSGYATMPTVYSGTMFVARGAEPSEAAREHSPDVFDQIVEIGGQVAQDAESAADSAEAAAASASDAESAKTAAETAQRAAENAQEAAESARDAAAASSTSAAGSSASAAQSAQAASAAQGAAEDAKTDAQTAASAAAGSARNAETSESNAYTYQQGAKEYRDETEEMLDDLVKYDNDEFASPLPSNADRLNGHPDSYFAKQEDMSAAEQGIAENRSGILSLRSVAERLGLTKVDKETGKGLSANDYSNEEKQKVAENAAARHTHANKSVLDQITQAMLDLIGTIAGKYVKPNGGIPKSDLASDVQTSLGKADSALQQHQSLSAYRTASAQDTLDAQKYSATNPPPYPVTSVNGQTGHVVLNYITFDKEES